MSCQPIGEHFTAILRRCQELQEAHEAIRYLSAPHDRKQWILAARDYGSLDNDETRLLIEAYGLQDA